MAKKAMAAFLLVVIAAWAEMTMAPMFAMQAGHMRPGHEMAVDMPENAIAHDHAGHHHAEHAAMVEGRPCCPGLHAPQPVAVFELASDSPACEDPHSCCFRQGPQSVPAPARDVQKLNRQMAPASAVTASLGLAPAQRAVRDNAPTLSPAPDVLGMTLRV